MPYATLQDLLARFGPEEIAGLTDRDGDGEPDQASIDAAAADVDAEIDTHLAGRYSLPLAHVPLILRKLAAALMRERLYHAAGARLDDENPARVEAKNARRLLTELAAGRAHLPLPTHRPSAGDVQMQSTGTRWDRNSSKGFI